MNWYLLSGVIGWAIGLLMGWLIGWALGWTYEAAKGEKEELSLGENSDRVFTLTKADVLRIVDTYFRSNCETLEEEQERIENMIRLRIDALPRKMWRSLSDRVERMERWVMETPVAAFSERIEKLERFHSDNMVPVTLESLPGPGESLPEISADDGLVSLMGGDISSLAIPQYIPDEAKVLIKTAYLVSEWASGIPVPDEARGIFKSLSVALDPYRVKELHGYKLEVAGERHRSPAFLCPKMPLASDPATSAPPPPNPIEYIPETWNGA